MDGIRFSFSCPLQSTVASKCCAWPGCLCVALIGFRFWIPLSGQGRRHGLNEFGMQVERRGEAVSVVSRGFREDQDLVS